MSRRILALALGATMMFSSSLGAFAATTPEGLLTELQGQTVPAALVTAINAAAAACSGAGGGGDACLAALSAVLAQAAGLDAGIKAQVAAMTEAVQETVTASPEALQAFTVAQATFDSTPAGSAPTTTATTQTPTATTQTPADDGDESDPTEDDTPTSPGA